jgi:hypothetical protein
MVACPDQVNAAMAAKEAAQMATSASVMGIAAQASADAGPESGDVRRGGPHHLLGFRLAGYHVYPQEGGGGRPDARACPPSAHNGFESE